LLDIADEVDETMREKFYVCLVTVINRDEL